MKKPDHVVALERAIQICGGSQAALAKAIADHLGPNCKIKQQTVSIWLKREILLDPEWCLAIEHVTNGEVTREQLRPDFFRARKTRTANRLTA